MPGKGAKPSFFVVGVKREHCYNNRLHTAGWNARCKGEPYDVNKKVEWREGWRDCDKAPESLRLLIVQRKIGRNNRRTESVLIAT